MIFGDVDSTWNVCEGYKVISIQLHCIGTSQEGKDEVGCVVVVVREMDFAGLKGREIRDKMTWMVDRRSREGQKVPGDVYPKPPFRNK